MKIVSKGWGHELWIVNKKEYCGKLLYFRDGKRCSFHYHKIKDETFYLQSGRILLRYSNDHENYVEKFKILEPGDSFYVPPELIHSMEALEPSELFEFSTEHFDSDSYRIYKGD